MLIRKMILKFNFEGERWVKIKERCYLFVHKDQMLYATSNLPVSIHVMTLFTSPLAPDPFKIP